MSDDDDSQGDPPATFKVGYGRPPAEHRFKKGSSGNPKGRRPKTKNIDTLLDQELDSIVVVKEGDRAVRMTKREIIVKQLAQRAMKGDPKAVEHLIKIARSNPKPEPVVLGPVPEDELEIFLKRVRYRATKDEHDDPSPRHYEQSDPEDDVSD
jgi:hypothetical protein